VLSKIDRRETKKEEEEKKRSITKKEKCKRRLTTANATREQGTKTSANITRTNRRKPGPRKAKDRRTLWRRPKDLTKFSLQETNSDELSEDSYRVGKKIQGGRGMNKNRNVKTRRTSEESEDGDSTSA